MYLRGVESHKVVFDIINRCRYFFSNVTMDETINKRLEADSDVSFQGHTRNRLDNFLLLNLDTDAKTQTNRRERSPLVPLLLAYFVYSGLVNYEVSSGLDTKANVTEMSNKLNDQSNPFKDAIVALNETRNNIHVLDKKVAENTMGINYLNETLQGFPRAMAFVQSAGDYHKDLDVALWHTNEALGRNRVSPALKILTKDDLWHANADEWSEVKSFRNLEGALRSPWSSPCQSLTKHQKCLKWQLSNFGIRLQATGCVA